MTARPFDPVTEIWPETTPEYSHNDASPVLFLARVIREMNLTPDDVVTAGVQASALEPLNASPMSSPANVAALLMPDMANLEYESFRVVLLTTRNCVLEVVELYKGSLNSAGVRVGEVFREAIRQNAAAILIAHNHPSGDPAPSPEDVALTKVIQEASNILDIPMLDHLVIGNGRYTSMKSAGLIG